MISIKNFIDNLANYGIPEFQRDFEWQKPKIEKFWDSIYRNYPLPTFFAWKVGRDSPVGLTFFTESFKNCKPILEDIVKFNDDNYHYNTTAICDGQQRLTSILIGLKGFNVGTVKLEKYIYFNPFLGYVNGYFEENQSATYFKILSANEVAKINDGNNINEPEAFWLNLSNFFNYVLVRENSPNRNPTVYLREFITVNIPNLNMNSRDHVFSTLMQLNSQIHRANYLHFVELNDTIHNDLEKADEFFIRINNGATMKPDSKLFALLSRYNSVENDMNLKSDFLEIKNQHKDLFITELKANYFLRVCLYILTNDVLFKVESFNKENCTEIIDNWNDIKAAINKTFNLIQALSLAKCISSNNSTIPIVYHIYKKLNLDHNFQATADEKKAILKYFLRSEISGYFGGEHGDSKLKRLKDNQDEIEYNIEYSFNIDDLIHTLPQGTTFDINDKRIETVLNYEYGKPMCRPLLHLIYQNLNPTLIFQVDHIQPKSICSSIEKINLHVQENNLIQDILNTYNKVSNLQLIPAACNNNKSDKLIDAWVDERLNATDHTCLNNQTSKNDYYRTNFIEKTHDTSYEDYLKLCNYSIFYNRRKEKLKQVILNILN